MTLLRNIETHILNPLIFLMFGLAVIFFLYGLVEYLWRAKDGKEDRSQAIRNITWGVVGMTIMVSVYGIMHFIVSAIEGLTG
ncbi:MAG: hypothetical protein WCX70_02665 [Candidatus Paceibacterota bacterium]|jgi:hypothetical protein